MRPSAETSRSRRRRQTAPPAELSKKRLETEVASIESGLKLLDVYTAALKDLKERGQDAAGDIKLALDVRHAPRDWSNAEILSVMSEIIDEHPRPRLEFVLGVLGVSKLPDTLDERLRSQGAKAYTIGVRNRSLRKKKEARERAERERREKKEREEREERERLEEQQRKEREEREERERLERERLEKEKAEEEKRKAAERKESESKRVRGKGRKGRRGRPPTRVVATERAKKMEMGKEANDAKERAVATPEEVQKGNAMEVDARGEKPSSDDNVTSNTNMKAEAGEAPADTRRKGPSEGAKVDKLATKAPLATSRRMRRMQSLTTSAAKQSQESEKKEEPTPSKEGANEATNTGSAKQKGNVEATREAAKSKQRITAVTNADDKDRKSATPPGETHSKKESQEASKVADASYPQTSVAEDASRKTRTSRLKATDGSKEAVTAPSDGSNAAAQSSKNATPTLIEESKIASALKESAAAVNGEVRNEDGNAATAKDIAADVGTGPVDLSGVNEMKEVALKEVAKEESVSKLEPEKAQDAKDVAMTESMVAREPETAKEPTEQKVSVQTPQKTSVSTEEKSKVTEAFAKSEDKEEVSRANAATSADKMKEKTATKSSKSDAKDGTKSEKGAKQASKASEIKNAQEEDKKEDLEGEDETGTKEAEVETEDFMADVFGSDEEGDKDETEEASEKRGRRYRTRGRQSDVSDSSEDAGTRKRESDGEAAKEEAKRGGRTGGRRVSRRMSNMRDEIVVAPTGRRMRRESRNLMNRAWELPEPDQYLLECVEVWEGVHANKISIPFREPVTAKDAPGYFDVVKQPMDLKTVKEMLQDGRIASPVEFYENMKLIVRNALLFNDRESDLYELAMELRDLIRKDTKPIVKSWKEARGLDSEESESESEVENARKRGKGRAKKRGRPTKSKKKRKRGREEEVGKIKKRRTLRRSSRNAGEDEE